MIFIIISVLCTIFVVYSAIKSLFNKQISVDLLASFALIVSMLHNEWGSATFISLMIVSAKIFGVYTDRKARTGIQSLLKLKPTTVKVKRNNQIIEIPSESVKKNETIIVEAGNRIAVDGTVQSGFASVDQSSLTGESLPVAKKKGDQVFSSTLNLSGTIFVTADKVGTDTNFAKIIKLMEDAQNQKVGMRSIIDNFTTYYILSTAFVSILLYLTTHNLSLVLSLLLVTCADDIAVAVPLTYMTAIARASQKGVIIKGGIFLEALDKVNTLIVDKTGTLTNGKIKVLHLSTFNQYHPNTVIQIAASMASLSSHPISEAIFLYGKENRFENLSFPKYKEVPGFGIVAQDSSNNKYLLGNIKLIEAHHVTLDNDQKKFIARLGKEGHNLVAIAKNSQVIGIIGLGDQLRLGVKTAIENIRSLGIKDIIMLTGDNSSVAKSIASQIGITNYHSSLLPQDKLKFIKQLPKSAVTAFVGDGINDSAALSQADVGIAMGAIGSDSAIEAADLTLMDDNFNKIYASLLLSHKVAGIVKQDFTIWGTVNIIGLLLVFIFHIPPQTAAAYNFITDFLPLLNSFRLFRYNFHR